MDHQYSYYSVFIAKGIGKLLIESIEKYIKESVGEWAVSLELISTIEAKAFYEKMGFEPRPYTYALQSTYLYGCV